MYALVLKSEIAVGTLNELLKVFGWSMNVLLSGIVPDRNHDDLPLPNARGYVADGIRGCLCQIRGDWEFYAVALGMAHWKNKANMCWLCKASHDDPRYYFQQFGKWTRWRAQREHTEAGFLN